MAITRAEALLRALASQEPMTFDVVKGEKFLHNENFKCIGGTIHHVFKYVMTFHMIIAYNDPDATVLTSANERAYLYKLDGYVQE